MSSLCSADCGCVCTCDITVGCDHYNNTKHLFISSKVSPEQSHVFLMIQAAQVEGEWSMMGNTSGQHTACTNENKGGRASQSTVNERQSVKPLRCLISQMSPVKSPADVNHSCTGPLISYNVHC